MARQEINKGAHPNTPGNDTLSSMVDKINSMSSELYDKDAELTESQIAGAIGYDTKATMDADTSQSTGTIAQVMNDGTASNNGYYRWDGSSWVKRAELYATTLDPYDTAEAITGKAALDTPYSKLWPYSINASNVGMSLYNGIKDLKMFDLSSSLYYWIANTKNDDAGIWGLTIVSTTDAGGINNRSTVASLSLTSDPSNGEINIYELTSNGNVSGLVAIRWEDLWTGKRVGLYAGYELDPRLYTGYSNGVINSHINNNKNASGNFINDVSFSSHRIKDISNAISDSDGVNLGQMVDYVGSRYPYAAKATSVLYGIKDLKLYNTDPTRYYWISTTRDNDAGVWSIIIASTSDKAGDVGRRTECGFGFQQSADYGETKIYWLQYSTGPGVNFGDRTYGYIAVDWNNIPNGLRSRMYGGWELDSRIYEEYSNGIIDAYLEKMRAERNRFFNEGGNYRNYSSTKKFGFALGGQSNAAGSAYLINNPPAWYPSPENGGVSYLQLWNENTDDFTNFVSTHPDITRGGTPRYGIELGLAYRLQSYLTQDIYAIKAAKGGTPLSFPPTSDTSFSPEIEFLNTDEREILNVEKKNNLAIQKQRLTYPDYEWKAYIWIQGEADDSPDRAAQYLRNLNLYMSYIRGVFQNERLPIIIVGVHKDSLLYYDQVRTAQQEFCRIDPYAEFIDINDLTFTSVGDNVHYNHTMIDAIAEKIYQVIKDY